MSEDAELEDLARRLAAADFSPESGIRNSLRAALLNRGRAARPPRFPARVFLFAAGAAALALLALLPSRPKTTIPAPLVEPSPASAVVHREAPRSAPTPASRLARAERYPKDALGLPILPGRFVAHGSAAEPSPLSSRAVADLIVTRAITLDDIFMRRTL